MTTFAFGWFRCTRVWIVKPVVGARPWPSTVVPCSSMTSRPPAVMRSKATPFGLIRKRRPGSMTLMWLHTPSCMFSRAVMRNTAARSTRACCVSAALPRSLVTPSVIAALPYVRSLADRPPPQHFGGDDEHGDEQQHDRGHRRERRVHLQQQVVPHPPRQGRRAAAGDEQRDRQLVERGEEGKQEAGEDAAADLRQRDVDERAPFARAEAPGGLIEPLVIGLQHRHDRDDDVRNGEDGVPDDEPQDRA